MGFIGSSNGSSCALIATMNHSGFDASALKDGLDQTVQQCAAVKSEEHRIQMRELVT